MLIRFKVRKTTTTERDAIFEVKNTSKFLNGAWKNHKHLLNDCDEKHIKTEEEIYSIELVGLPPELEEKKDVHTEHCCLTCGCKYSDKKCTVITGKLKQSYEHSEYCRW